MHYKKKEAHAIQTHSLLFQTEQAIDSERISSFFNFVFKKLQHILFAVSIILNLYHAKLLL